MGYTSPDNYTLSPVSPFAFSLPDNLRMFACRVGVLTGACLCSLVLAAILWLILLMPVVFLIAFGAGVVGYVLKAAIDRYRRSWRPVYMEDLKFSSGLRSLPIHWHFKSFYKAPTALREVDPMVRALMLNLREISARMERHPSFWAQFRRRREVQDTLEMLQLLPILISHIVWLMREHPLEDTGDFAHDLEITATLLNDLLRSTRRILDRLESRKG